MIGIYDDAGARLAMAYRSLTVNDDAYPVGSAAVDYRFDAVTEPKAQADGMEAYGSRRMSAMIRIDGVVKADSIAQLHDRIDAMNAAFDPGLATDADTGTINLGYLPFTFSVPTADTANYASGLKPMQYYVRSVALPVARTSKFEGFAARFTLLLQAVDPRRFLQTSTNLAISSSSVALDNSLASYTSWPTITIVMSGAGSSSFAINNASDDYPQLVLDLSGLSASDVVVVDCEQKDITLNGTSNMALYDSGDYPRVELGSQFFGATPLTGITSVTLTWRRAFV